MSSHLPLLRTGAFALLAGGSATVLYSRYANSWALERARVAEVGCFCGTVRGHVLVRPCSISIACGCADCMRFNKWASTQGRAPVPEIQAAQQVYRREFDTDRTIDPEEAFRVVKLREPTETLRVVTKCCGTPVGILPDRNDRFALFMVFHSFFKDATHGANPVEYAIQLGEDAAKREFIDHCSEKTSFSAGLPFQALFKMFREDAVGELVGLGDAELTRKLRRAFKGEVIGESA